MKRIAALLCMFLVTPALAASVASFGTYYSNFGQANPINPTGTTSAVGVMMGLAGPFTPIFSGTVRISISGNAANSGASNSAVFQIRYGTGAAPANGAALTGTATGIANSATSTVGADVHPFNSEAIVTGLTLATAYWIDLSLAAGVGGTASVKNIVITVIEF